MSAAVKLVPVQAAYDDLLQRSLSKISCDLARLIYLASTRDYNTGTYHHDGLASRFRADAASKALEIAHRQVFYTLAACSLVPRFVNICTDAPFDVIVKRYNHSSASGGLKCGSMAGLSGPPRVCAWCSPVNC